MPQTKEQKRRNAIALKQENIALRRGTIEHLRHLMSRPIDTSQAEVVQQYDRELNEHRAEIIQLAEGKIRIHERDIENTRVKLR